MTPFRTLVAGLCAVAIASSPAMAAGLCMQPAEKTAFEVHSLQSALVVAALNCRQEDAYNSFVTRFRGDLGGAYRGVSGHFRRTGGGTRKLDQYITNLAKSHSQEGSRQGSAFCANVAPLWQQVMELRTGRELARLYEARSMTSFYVPEPCANRLRHVRSQPAAAAKPAQPAQRNRTTQRAEAAQTTWAAIAQR